MFNAFQPLSGDLSWGYFITGLVVLCFGAVFVLRGSQPTEHYHPGLAWLRAAAYFSLCWLLSWVTGVFDVLWDAGAIQRALQLEPGQGVAVVLILSFEAFAYGYLWSLGTYHNDRKLYPVSVLAFGALWGLSEAQLFLSFWAVAEWVGLNVWWTAISTYVLIGAFYGPWHRFYWDFLVAPEHNITSWNMKKVFLVHTPNVILTLAYLAYFEDAHGFIGFMVLCLILASAHMRFPAPWDQLTRIPIVDTYVEKP